MSTKAEIRRFQALQRLGCIACHVLGFFSPPDIHHILSGGRRTGHKDTIPLCPYHHRGVITGTMVYPELIYGPSLANGSKPFHERFGTQAALLALTNELLETQVCS